MKIKFTASLEKELVSAIKIRAIEEGKNVSEIIETLIAEYLKNKPIQKGK